jgi:hypothetical protein
MSAAATTASATPPEKQDPQPALSGYVSTILVAVVVFLSMWLAMQFNYGVVLPSVITPERTAAALATNGIAFGAATAAALVAYLYVVIYKLALGGHHNGHAAIVAFVATATAMGAATLLTNIRITQIVDVVSMFANTVGVWYISWMYASNLKDMVEYKSVDATNEPMSTDPAMPYTSARAELAAILLSRYSVADLEGRTSDIEVFIPDDKKATVVATIDIEQLRGLAVLKYLVGQACWLYFAAMVAALAAIARF